MEGQAVTETKALGPKVLIVHELYGRDKGISSNPDEIRQEEIDINLFKSRGYSIIRGGEFTGEPGQLGLLADKRLMNANERTRMLARAAGCEIPRDLTVEEAAVGHFPIVAKIPSRNAGTGVFVIEDAERFVRFETYRELINQNAFQYEGDPGEKIKAALRQVKEGNFNSAEDNYHIYQEFIDSPSDFFTSIRVLVDAYGEIHASELIRSRDKKWAKRMENVPLQEAYTPIEEITHGGYFDVLILHPQGPLYLNAHTIVSNVAQGGIGVILKGEAVSDKVNRNVLIAHGIDPDHPELPDTIKDLASRIGYAARGFLPYVGVDFMMRKSDLSPILLEVNAGPMLDFDYFKPGEVATVAGRRSQQEEFRKAMIRRIASK